MPALHFTDRDWEQVRRDTLAWWEGELERPLVYLAVTDPVPDDRRRYTFLSNYPLDMSAEEIVARHEPLLAATHFYGDAFPWWWVNFGPGIAAGFMGARVHSVAEPSETVWFGPAHQVPFEDLTLDYRPDNPWWQRVKAVTQAILDHWEGRVAVGHTDLGGNLDILASFTGTEALLIDLIDRPEVVEKLIHCITGLWLRYYDELDAMIRPVCGGTSCWTPLWSPGKTYMLQSDFSYMISPQMFERFVMPDLVACCQHLDHPFYHLDGKGEIPHLDLLLSIPNLRGIQWIPGDGQSPPEKWLPLLQRIREGGKLCQVFVTPEGALEIVRNLGGRGFYFVISADPMQFRDPERVRAFLRQLAVEDLAA